MRAVRAIRSALLACLPLLLGLCRLDLPLVDVFEVRDFDVVAPLAPDLLFEPVDVPDLPVAVFLLLEVV